MRGHTPGSRKILHQNFSKNKSQRRVETKVGQCVTQFFQIVFDWLSHFFAVPLPAGSRSFSITAREPLLSSKIVCTSLITAVASILSLISSSTLAFAASSPSLHSSLFSRIRSASFDDDNDYYDDADADACAVNDNE